MKIYLIISNSIQIQITSLDYEALFKFICLNKNALSIKNVFQFLYLLQHVYRV